jgi:hypothetical protein
MDDYNLESAPDKSLRSKLNGMFNRHNYVGVKNILKTDMMWPVALEQNEIVSMNPADNMNEDAMARANGSTFLPGDAAVRQQRVVKVELKAGERRMLIGEAAYVIIPRIFSALVRERYGTSKMGLAKLRNPSIQAELLKEILVGPVINNVGEAMQTFVNDKMKSIEGFTDVQADAPKGFNNPETLAKAQATRDANKTAKSQTA